MSDDNSLKITVPSDIKPELLNMRIPSWLVMTNATFDALFSDAHSLQCHYGAYWAIANTRCQIDIARVMLARLDHLLTDVINPYDSSAAANGYFEDQLLRFNTNVQEALSKILDDDQIHDITFAPVTGSGMSPAVLLGDDVDTFMDGQVVLDFVHKHPVNQRAFEQYCMAVWSRMNLMASENDPLRTPS